MQSTNEIVEEAKRKRTLASLKPTSLPENYITINTTEPVTQYSVNTSLPESHKAINTTKTDSLNYSNVVLTENHKNGNPAEQKINNSVIEVKPENHNTIKKVKITVYITEESWEDFNNIYGRRILDKRKTDKGDLMTEAIELLKQKEDARKP